MYQFTGQEQLPLESVGMVSWKKIWVIAACLGSNSCCRLVDVVVVQYDLIIESGGLCSAYILKYHLPMATKIHVLKRTILATIIPVFASGPRSYGNSYSQKNKNHGTEFH